MFLYGPALFPQSNGDTLRADLKEVTVVASRTEEAVKELPRSVTVLDRSDLDALPYLSLGNLLEEQSGMYMVGTGQIPGSNQSLFLRGGNTNQNAIYIDGVRLQDVSTVNGVADLSELPLESVDRIEILRGAQGTLFGSPASGGVLMITTNRKKESGINGVIGTSGGLYLDGGWTSGVSGSLTGRTKNGFYGRLDVSTFFSDGFNATIDTLPDSLMNKPDNDGFRKRMIHALAGYNDDTYDVGFSIRRTEMNTDIDRQAFVDDDNYTLDFNRTSSSFHFARKFSPAFDMRLTAGWSRTERKAENDSSLKPDINAYDRTYSFDDYSGDQLSSELTATFQKNNFSLVAGAGLLQESMKQKNYYYSAVYDPYIYEYEYDLDTVRPLAQTSSFFLHSSLEGSVFSEKLSAIRVLAGGRYQNNTICGSNLSLDASLLWMLEYGMSFYVSFATGFTTPSLYQQFAPDVYVPYDGTPSSNVTLGDKSLLPETSRNWELGIRQDSEEEWKWELSLFRNVTDNLIDFVYLWNGSIPIDELSTDFSRDDYRGSTYANLGEQTVYGAAFSFSRTLFERLKLEFSGCILDGRLSYDGDATSDKRLNGLSIQLLSNGQFVDEARTIDGLVRRPDVFRCALTYRFIKGPQLRLQVRRVGKRFDSYYDNQILPYGALARTTMDGYVLADLSGSWKVNEYFSTNLCIDNLFNTRYQEIRGFATRGIGVQIGLKTRF
ncbi:MAG: TonB-dependent receptor [Bacteroidota bacterium]